MTEYSPELQAALKELNRITGLSLEISAAASDEEKAVLNQIRSLSAAYKEKYNKTHFLQSLMTDPVPAYDVRDRASRLRIDPDERRVLFYLETRGSLDDTILEILKNLFPSQTKTYLVQMSEHTLVILRPLKASETEEHIPQIARSLVDTLNTEALTHVQLAYSAVMETLLDLSSAFKETGLALKVGKLFYSEQTVFPYNRLGVGRLIYQLPVSVCESFLDEIFGSDVPSYIDDETNVAVDRFLQNNLNIAETARQLHMHRNTLIYRLDQIEKRTGLDVRRFEDAMTFKIAAMVINYLQTERNA